MNYCASIPAYRQRTCVSPSDSATSNFARQVRPLAIFAPWSELSTSSRNQNCGAATTSCWPTFVASLFPHGGFGSLIVSGNLSRDGATFYASRILSFLPDITTKTIQAPMRKCVFYEDLMMYRDSRRKVEILLDQRRCRYCGNRLGTSGNICWVQSSGVKATFVQKGRYRHRKREWELETWQTPLPARIEVALPDNITIKSPMPEKPIIVLESLPTPLSKFEFAWKLRRLERDQLRESAMDLESRVILTFP